MREIFGTAVLVLTFLASLPASAQQMGERSGGFSFQVFGSNAALNKAVAIEQAEDGFGDDFFSSNAYTTTMNETNAIGTMTEIQATLDGDSSTVTLSANPVQDNAGTQGSTSAQSSGSGQSGTGTANNTN
jgi:hypothetical protein